MRINLAVPFKTRTGAPDKDAKLKNAYIEVRNGQSIVRKRPIAQGGVSIGTGTAQGGIGLNIAGTDYIYTFNGDVGALDTLATAGTTYAAGTSYSIGDHVSAGFIDYWSLTDANVGNTPSSSPASWSTSYVPAVPFSGTYATWNPADKATGITLSNGDLTTTMITSTGIMGRSDISKSSGKWYWELTINYISELCGIVNIGIANSSAPVENNYAGLDVNGWGIMNMAFDVSPYSDKWHNGVGETYGDAAAQGVVVGIALDMDTGQVEFYIGGVSQGVAYSGISGAIFAAIGLSAIEGISESAIVTANFGASAFTYSVPVGYNSGLYT